MRKMEQTESKGFYQYAMQYGTYLGIFWAIMYILLFKFPYSPSLSSIALTILFCSPFLAGKFAINYRKKECGNNIKYPQAWTFLFCMYICATLFSAMTNYVFFNLIDQGSFMMEINNILSQMINSPDIEEATRVQFEEMQDWFSKQTVNDIIWQLLNNNIFSSLALPPIIALFVRNSTKNQ